MFAAPPPTPTQPRYCALCLGCCPPVVLMRVFSASLCYFCHTYREGAHGGGDTFLLSVCFFHNRAARRYNISVRCSLYITDARVTHTYTHTHPPHQPPTHFYLLACISSFPHLSDLISLPHIIKMLKMTCPEMEVRLPAPHPCPLSHQLFLFF